MQLIIDGSFVDDTWLDRSGDETVSADDIKRAADLDLILSHAQVASLEFQGSIVGRNGRLGICVDSDIDLAQIETILPCLALVVVRFPSSADGRGFSVARQLRNHGFAGELRARGPLIADQYALARACGFDSIEIPCEMAKRQPEAQWRHAQHEIGVMYQPGYRAVSSVFEARHSDREAG